MIKYMLIIIAVFFFSTVTGQSLSTVRGRVVEVTSGDALEFITLVLKTYHDSTIIKSVVSDSLGKFEIAHSDPGQYYIETNLIGFESRKTSSFELKEGDHLDLGIIQLAASDFLLDEVEITAISPVLVTGIDRKIYYPENDIQAQSGSASDILQSIPSITVESEGEILLRGSGNITFLLNGKPSGLLKNNSAVVLEQIPAHLIERIEVITNPSAKYKPDGTAGIINIVTKKDMLPGFNGSILANASTQQRYNGNISLNYNPGKVNIAALYGYWQNYNPRTFTDFRIIRDGTMNDETLFDLRSTSTAKPSSHTATLSLDYQPNEKNNLGLSGSWRAMEFPRNSAAITTENNSAGLINDYTTTRNDADNESEWDISAYAEHQFKKPDHTISLEAQYESNDELEDTEFTDVFRFPEYPDYNGRTKIHNKGSGTSVTLDYVNPLEEDMEFEAGYEGEFSTGDLDFFSEYLDQDEQLWKNDIEKTNRFLFNQDIHALYGTLSKSIEALGILAGLRAEQTNIVSNLVNLDSIIPADYFNLFPTLHVTYELGDKHAIGMSYSRRVNRPDPDELNPFPEYVDIRDIEAGNPYLKPEQIHSIELGYQFRSNLISFMPTLYYRYTYDAFSEVTRYINDSTLLTTHENLNTRKSGGLEFIVSWSPSQKFNLNLNNNLFYQTIDASNLGFAGEKNILSANAKLAAYINIFPTTRFQANANYRSGMLTAQGRSLPFYFINLGVRQELFGKKASLTVTVSDIFNTMKWQNIIDTPFLYQEVVRKRKSRIIYFGFSYRFGFGNKKDGEEMLFDDRI